MTERGLMDSKAWPSRSTNLKEINTESRPSLPPRPLRQPSYSNYRKRPDARNLEVLDRKASFSSRKQMIQKDTGKQRLLNFVKGESMMESSGNENADNGHYESII